MFTATFVFTVTVTLVERDSRETLYRSEMGGAVTVVIRVCIDILF